MNDSQSVRRLSPEDAETLVGLRREALENDPFAFSASPEDDRGLSLDFVRSFLGDMEEQAVFGAFDGDALVGMAGIHREPKIKRRHIAHVWGVYVSPAVRGRGLGRAMMQAAIEQARRWEGVELIQLGAATNTPAPIRLYESLGFRIWGVERKAVKWNGEYADDAQMLLEL